MFIKQMERTQNLLDSVQQKPLAPTHMISTLQAELTNFDSIHTSYRPLISVATQLLKMAPSFNWVSTSNRHARRRILPFLGDALSWLMGTATSKDISSVKKRVNQLTATQHKQQETLVHIISVLIITRDASQVNRQHINVVMDAVDRTSLHSTTSKVHCTTAWATSRSYSPSTPY